MDENNEKTLCKSPAWTFGLNPAPKILLIIGSIFFVLSFILPGTARLLGMLLGLLLMGVGIYLLFYLRYEITVTDKRVFVKSDNTKVLDLPINKIGSTEMSGSSSLIISTAYKRMRFFGIKNCAEIHKVISDLLPKTSEKIDEKRIAVNQKKRNATLLSFACALLGIALVLSLVLCGEFEVTRYSWALGHYLRDEMSGYKAAFSGDCAIALVLFILDCVSFIGGLVCLILFINFKIGSDGGEKRESQRTYENPPAPQSNAIDDLVKLKSLLDAGVITEEEFNAKKKELLGL